jgi:hypothetical protein
LELLELLFHVVGSAEEEALMGFDEHGRVVEGVASGNDVVVEEFQAATAALLLLGMRIW